MNPLDKYTRIVSWSEEDKKFIGISPEFCGPCCHGDDPQRVFEELGEIINEWIEIEQREKTKLPAPMDYETASDASKNAYRQQLVKPASAA